MTKITSRQLATLKRNAMSIYPQVVKAEKLQAKIVELQNELDTIKVFIDATETGSRLITGGFNSTDLIQRKVIDTGKVDDRGQVIKITKWEPIADRLITNEDGTYTVVVPVCNCTSNECPSYSEDAFSEPIDEIEEV